jgi:hypothetical protein
VAALSTGQALEERIEFPGGSALLYRLHPGISTDAEFSGGVISVSVPAASAKVWEQSADIGIYYRAGSLEVAIEKDLECVEAPEEERDPYAYPRKAACG